MLSPCCVCFVQIPFSTAPILSLSLPPCCITVFLSCSPRYAIAKHIYSLPTLPILLLASHSLFACTLNSLCAPVFSKSPYLALPVVLLSPCWACSVTGDICRISPTCPAFPLVLATLSLLRIKLKNNQNAVEVRHNHTCFAHPCTHSKTDAQF